VTPPKVIICAPRSPEFLQQVLDSLKVETTERYQPQVFPGVGKRTKCNFYVEDACGLLSVHMPKGLLARQQIAWLKSPAASQEGWFSVMLDRANELADRGCPVIVAWVNPIEEQSSHVAMMRKKMRIAQAGRTNFSDGAIIDGFGQRVVSYHAHL